MAETEGTGLMEDASRSGHLGRALGRALNEEKCREEHSSWKGQCKGPEVEAGLRNSKKAGQPEVK